MPARFLRWPVALVITAASLSAADSEKQKIVTTKPTFTNRLAKEKSPYLLQHQHNPVDWYPWGPEAFEKAKKEKKPIFLSIGYSTCHWCHVMEHESFEEEATAKLLNEHFVPIKVDREERPDVDKVYMTFVQATTGSGGWPMSVWLTPDLKPFIGGTYYPPEDRGGRPGFKTVLKKIADGWKNDSDGIVKHGEDVAKQLKEFAASTASKTEVTAKAALYGGLNQLAKRFDDEHGGFGDAPKFPQPSIINFLLRMSVRKGLGATPESEERDRALARKMALFTLEKMAAGGMHDHLGGGFHRYSVDTFWHVPHYEKMLYDQGQLARAYTDAYQLTRDNHWKKAARDVLDYVIRDMTDKEGGFYSAEDADSLPAADAKEKTEGAFYVWTKAELDQVLGDDAEVFNRFYGVEADGNSPRGSDPLGELKGKNTLIQRMDTTALAKLLKKTEAEVEQSLERSRKKLFELRAKRPRPHLDDKIIVAWNGLMISAFARAAQVFDEPKYLQAAQASARFIKAKLWKDGALIRSFRHEPSKIAGFADDYAALIAGLLDLYEADFDTGWLQWALDLQAKMDAQFYDKEHGGYFQTPPDQSDVLFRSKEDYDGAEPTPSSLAAGNLLRLAQLTGSKEFRDRAEKTIKSVGDQLDKLPSAMSQMLCAVDLSVAKSRQVVVAGPAAGIDTAALLKEVRTVFAPNQLVLLADAGAGQAWLGKKLEALQGMGTLQGKAAAYVCENYVCQAPETDPVKLRELLVQ
jgi:uncharacterized protein YyaL (SSP411 family)